MTWPHLNYLAITVAAVGATLLSGAGYAIFASTMAKLAAMVSVVGSGDTTSSSSVKTGAPAPAGSPGSRAGAIGRAAPSSSSRGARSARQVADVEKSVEAAGIEGAAGCGPA